MNLIDRDALREKMHRMNRASASVEDIMSMQLFYGESVRRCARWEFTGGGATYSCSDCHYVAFPRETREWNFCPQCGAKMEEVE